MLIQINADALLSGRSNPVRRLAEHLCLGGFADVMASDGHRAASWRLVTTLSAAADTLAKIVGRPRARWMTADVPAAIITGNAISEAPPIEKHGLRPAFWRH